MSETTPRVLLVEDDPAERRLFREAASETGVAEVVVATDGREALDFLPQRGEETDDTADFPELILLDLDLPKKDGFAVLDELKSSPTSHKRVPVLILSNSNAQSDVDTAYDLGANAYLTKPNHYDDFRSLVETIEGFWLSEIEQPSH